MELIHCCLKSTYDTYKEKQTFGDEEIKQNGYLPFATWNSFRLLARRFCDQQEEYVFVVVDSTKISSLISWETDTKGHQFPHIQKPIPMAYITCVPFYEERKLTTHILMNTSMIDEGWCYPILKKYIKKEDEVCVLALSFFDDTKTIDDWNRQYQPGRGIDYKNHTDVFYRYGIKKEQLHWVNYFQDKKVDIENKILNSSILFLPGGAPDLFMKRIRACKLTSLLKNYRGIMLGYSAGAMIQLDNYHITPDEDYPAFTYAQGLGCLQGFAIEPHYQKSKASKESIRRVLQEKQKPVYAIYEKGGMVISNQQMEFFGNVDIFEP